MLYTIPAMNKLLPDPKTNAVVICTIHHAQRNNAIPLPLSSFQFHVL